MPCKQIYVIDASILRAVFCFIFGCILSSSVRIMVSYCLTLFQIRVCMYAIRNGRAEIARIWPTLVSSPCFPHDSNQPPLIWRSPHGTVRVFTIPSQCICNYFKRMLILLVVLYHPALAYF